MSSSPAWSARRLNSDELAQVQGYFPQGSGCTSCATGAVWPWRSRFRSLLLLLFGYALTLDLDQIPTVIYDQDRTAQSREMISRFEGSRYFQVVERDGDYRSFIRRVDRSTALVAVVIPKGFARDLAANKAVDVQLLIDGSDSNTASIAAGYAEALVLSYSATLREEQMQRRGAGKLKVPVDVRMRVLYNNEMKSRNFIIPGLIAVILMIIASMLTSLTVAREWGKRHDGATALNAGAAHRAAARQALRLFCAGHDRHADCAGGGRRRVRRTAGTAVRCC